MIQSLAAQAFHYLATKSRYERGSPPHQLDFCATADVRNDLLDRPPQHLRALLLQLLILLAPPLKTCI